MVKRLKLNEKTLREAEPKPGVSYQIFDTDVIGFAARVQASGARTFTIDYRHAGRQRRMNIGRWPEWSVTAVEVAQQVLTETQFAILPLVPYLDTLRWVFIAVTLIGIAVAIHARIDDWKRGQR